MRIYTETWATFLLQLSVAFVSAYLINRQMKDKTTSDENDAKFQLLINQKADVNKIISEDIAQRQIEADTVLHAVATVQQNVAELTKQIASWTKGSDSLPFVLITKIIPQVGRRVIISIKNEDDLPLYSADLTYFKRIVAGDFDMQTEMIYGSSSGGSEGVRQATQQITVPILQPAQVYKLDEIVIAEGQGIFFEIKTHNRGKRQSIKAVFAEDKNGNFQYQHIEANGANTDRYTQNNSQPRPKRKL